MIGRSLLELLTLVAALGSGVIAGVFLAFSAAVMTALGRLPPLQGIAAMQTINRVIINPWFLAPFLGTAAIGLVMAGASLVQWHTPAALYWLAGSVLYLGGAVLVTMAANVPRNEALARAIPESAEGMRLWADYLATWTWWNHVRTVAAIAAAVCFTIAYRRT
jgi:uncharacterized membrane protein